MRRDKILVLFMLCLLLILNLPFSHASQVKNLTIAFPEDKPQTRFDKPLLVAGRWQYINVTLDNPADTLTLYLYKGEEPPASYLRNDSNYYAWRYTSPDSWQPLYSYGGCAYINESACFYSENTYSFFVAVSQNAIPKNSIQTNWTLRVDCNGVQVFSQQVVLEMPMTGIEPKRGTIVLRVDPFTIKKLSSSFGIHNIGNTPITVTVSYNKFSDLINTSNNGIKLSINETSVHNVTITTKKWPPGIIRIEGTSTASPLYWFPCGTLTLTPRTPLPVPEIYIYVGRSNYEIMEVGDNITFQYKKNITMKYGETKDITAYLCGNGDVTISLSSVNVTIFDVWYDGKRIENPISFMVHSTNSSEHPLKIKIGAQQPNCTGYITYNLNIEGHYYTYKTVIDIGAPVSGENKGNPIITFIVISALIVAIIYLIFIRWR